MKSNGPDLDIPFSHFPYCIQAPAAGALDALMAGVCVCRALVSTRETAATTLTPCHKNPKDFLAGSLSWRIDGCGRKELVAVMTVTTMGPKHKV